MQELKPEESKFAQAAVAGKPPSRAPPPEASEESAVTNLTPFGSAEVQKERPLPNDGRVRYTREFLLSIQPLCTELPPAVEAATLSQLTPNENDKVRGPPGPPDRDWKATARGPPGGGAPGPPGMRGGRGGARRQQGGIDGDTWERGKALPPMPGNQYGGRGPPPGMRMSSGPLPALHKTDSAYKIGHVITEDPEEEKAQKSLKSMLNKITPQNFEKITKQIIDKINERKKAKTLSGFIGQIFDKALTETTFSELYARLVASLNPALPELEDDDGSPVQFRRTLLNKCQEEFETGAVAMKAVAERERREHDQPKGQPEVEETETEDGEITDEQREQRDAAAEAKRQDKVAAEAEVKARKRMLGNIIFVGQLYRFGVLTEGVMHSCIKTLLEETENPRSEDVECLCKLLTTVGRPMDSSQRSQKSTDEKTGHVSTVLTKDLMDVYFKRIDALGKNEALDVRHRFMLRDLIDLRRNSWVLRRQAEGPKKIDEIHRDAALERSRSQLLDRQGSRVGGRDQRGPPRPFDNRVDAPIRTMNRVGSQDSLGAQSFRPGGRPAPSPRYVVVFCTKKKFVQGQGDVSGCAFVFPMILQRWIPCHSDLPCALARKRPIDFMGWLVTCCAGTIPSSHLVLGFFVVFSHFQIPYVLSFYHRPAPPAGERPPAPPSKEPSASKEEEVEEEEDEESETLASATSGKELSYEEIESKIKGLLVEVFNTRDLDEAVLCMKELQDGKAGMALVVDLLVSVSLERKETVWDVVKDLLKAAKEENIIEQSEFEQGVRSLLDKLDDVTVDVPLAPSQVADVLAFLIANEAADFKVVVQHIKEADADPQEGEEPMAIGSGVALKTLGSLLRNLKEAQNAEALAENWKASGLDFKSFMPKIDREDDGEAEKFVSSFGLAEIVL